MTILLNREYTAEEFLGINGDQSYELVDGKLVEKGMGARSSFIGAAVIGKLRSFATPGKLGLVFESECGYQIWPDRPNCVRKPDVSFVRAGRLPNDAPPEGWIRIAPDLAVEVISPNDEADEMTARVVDFIRAGVRLIWVIDPSTTFVQIFRQNGSAGWLLGTGDLSGQDVLPGFTCRIEELFPPLPPAE
jgi:Uma2 family endonuclease